MEAISEFGAVDSSRRRPTSELAQGYTFLADGDVAYAKVTPCFENGKGLRATALPGGHAFATTEITVLRPSSLLDSRYLAWTLQSEEFRAPGEAHMSGAGGLKRVPESYAARFRVRHPSVDVQRAIADYLDRETAQIDAFIAKTEETITLLSERRAAFIDEVLVRAGANVPVIPIKRAVDVVTVGIVVTPAKWYVESGIPALRGLNVRSGSISTDDLVYLSNEGHQENRKSELRAGDVVVVRTGQAGAAAVVPAELDRANAIDLLIVRTGAKVVPEFLAHFLNSDSTSRLIAYGSVGSIQGHFNVGSLRELPIPLLPRDEQWGIVRMLDEWAAKIDLAIATARRGIGLARDRRAALISAAVTGKIDVEVAV
jgi:type I restriction enzyme S subunit